MRYWKRIAFMVTLSLFPRLLAAHSFDIASLAGEHWYGLYLNGQKSGYACNRLSQDASGQVTVAEEAHFLIRMSGIRQDMRISSKRIYSSEGALILVESEVNDPAGAKTFKARVEGDTLVLHSEVGGAAIDKTLPKPHESLRDALKQVELVGAGAKVGDTLAFSLFDPMFEREMKGVSRVVGMEERVFEGAPARVYQITTTLEELGITTNSYVTDSGVTLEDTFAQVMTMRLEPEDLAKDVRYSNDVIVSNAALVEKPIGDPRSRSSLRLVLRGPLTTPLLFNDERQQLHATGDKFEFTGKRVVLDGFTPVRLPVTDADAAQWIKPTTYIQSDHPKLAAKAKEIINDEADSFKVSERLCHWVYGNVHTTFSARLSNALEVLEDPQGDCTEHSILFIGLARAAGLPAREVAGLVYVEGDKPGFYFHQWAKVWIGKWIDVDPTFNQPLADATHIKLAEGDLLQQAALLPVIGQIKIEVPDDSPSS
ncbi:MAG: transglutaminase domain-containing protein [Candidatus Hydrogenedentes bacterium]|nr:transglutaminase domain-containing protein [Candidatus Hydrogenedentota bacterium]